MIDKASDDWPTEKYKNADPKFLHALGHLSLTFNMVEDALCWIFTIYFPSEHKFSQRLFHELNNRIRVDNLKAIIRQTENNSQVKELMLFGLHCFDICTDNRNTLLHGMMDAFDEEILHLTKRARKNPLRFVDYSVSLPELRQIAEETADTYIFVTLMMIWLDDRKRGEQTEPLPKKPARPRRLRSSPHIEAGADASPQP